MQLSILGRKIKVKILAQEKLGRIAHDPYTIGLFDPAKMTIYLAADLSEKDRTYVLCHEACHAAQFITGLDQSIPEALIEVICQTHASLFMDLLKK